MKNLSFNILQGIRKGLITGLLLIITNSGLFASHVVGGEITYEWISGNTYKIRFDYYRDCSGIQAPSMFMNYQSVSCGLGPFSVSVPMVGSPVMVTPVCATSLLNASCNGGLLYSVERLTYETIITLPATCNDWEFFYTECCRNGAITNLIDPATNSNYLSTRLNNADFPFNNSVRFGAIPANIISNGTTTNLSWNTYDVDGDSLIYELVNARTTGPANLAYAPGFNYQQPFASSLPTTLDITTGLLTVTPNITQVAIVAMKVSEYRNGILVGEVYRDYQIAVVNSTNNLPSLTGINGGSSFVTNVCPADTLQFDIFSSDPDPGQSLSLVLGTTNTNIGFSSTAGPTPTGSFFWIPSIGDISSQPYVFNVDVNDDFCDYYGTQSFAYHVYVNGCNTNEVWPGDANSDGSANLYDLLALGIAFNDNGPVRPSASLSWVAQPSPDWSNTFISGINYKHADTDGNGTVNIDDTTAIMLNYGLNHPLRYAPVSSQNVAELNVTANFDTVGTQMAVNFDMALSSPVDSIYGLAFRMYFDPSLVDITTAQITYAGSLFGTNGVDMVKVDKTVGTSGFIDIAISKTNQQNISGSGQVARVTIVTTDNVSGKVTLNVEPFDVEAITANEFPVTVNTSGDGVVIDPNFLSIEENILDQMISVHPVPAHDLLNFNFSGIEKIQTIRFFDMNGKEILVVNQPENKLTIDIKSFAKGVYYMKVTIGESNIIKKIVKI